MGANYPAQPDLEFANISQEDDGTRHAISHTEHSPSTDLKPSFTHPDISLSICSIGNLRCGAIACIYSISVALFNM